MAVRRIGFFRPILENLENRTVPAQFAVGASPGALPFVNIYESGNPNPVSTIQVFNEAFRGGVRVATGDFNNDSVLDVVAMAGPGGGPHVKLINGANGQTLSEFMAYDPAYRGSGFLATGDFNGDGFDDLVIGADEGGGPHVKAINGRTGAEEYSFFAFEPEFRGGARVAIGQVDTDVPLEIITGAGPGGGPRVQTYDSESRELEDTYFSYDPGFRNGIFIATGDTDNDGRDEIITGAGQGGGPHVKYHDLVEDRDEVEYFAYSSDFRGGVYVSSIDDSIGGDDIITAPVSQGGANVRIYDDHGGLQHEFFDSIDDGDDSNDDENDDGEDDDHHDGIHLGNGVGGISGGGGHHDETDGPDSTF